METAWLVEFPIEDGQVVYLGRTIRGIGPTPENLDALRFSRQEDAEMVIGAIQIDDCDWTHARAVEHQWG